jgi:hypothetical protein
MPIALDHLVVAARTLDEGARWIEGRLGVAPAGGGKHAVMGTHNRLLSLGPEAYLELIAIDPEAPPPGRPRWFSLDTEEMAARLAQGPTLIHWVARTDDIHRDIAALGHAVEVLRMHRGDFRWRIGVPRDGALFEDGTRPTLIQWEGEERPPSVLPDVGLRLQQLLLRREGDRGHPLRAALQTPRGVAWLPE